MIVSVGESSLCRRKKCASRKSRKRIAQSPLTARHQPHTAAARSSSRAPSPSEGPLTTVSVSHSSADENRPRRFEEWAVGGARHKTHRKGRARAAQRAGCRCGARRTRGAERRRRPAPERGPDRRSGRRTRKPPRIATPTRYCSPPARPTRPCSRQRLRL